MITVLLSPEELEADETWVEGDRYRHLFRARRLAVGARLRAVDGEGRARWAEVAEVDRRQGLLTLGEEAPSLEPARRVELVVAALRKERASWLVEKATEVGVRAVRFVNTERTPREFGDGSFDRFRRVAEAALEQCQRSRLPEITGMHPWEGLEELLSGTPRRLFLDGAGEPAVGLAGERPLVLLVGPEGGFTGSERDELLERGCRPISLGSRTLRVETAAVAGAALALCA